MSAAYCANLRIEVETTGLYVPDIQMYATDNFTLCPLGTILSLCYGSIAGLAIQQLPCHFTAFSLLLTSCTICELNLFRVISLFWAWYCNFFARETISKEQQSAHAASDCMFSCLLTVIFLHCPLSNWCRLSKINLSADGFCRRYNDDGKIHVVQ